MNEITTTEQLNHLAEEVTAIIAERKFAAGLELLTMRHEIGRAILDSPLYAKNKKGQGKLLLAVAERTGLHERSLRYCIEFASKYPVLRNALQSSDPAHKLPVWRDIVRGLPSGRREKREERPKCRHCPEHCPN